MVDGWAFPPAKLVANDRNGKSDDKNSKYGANSSNQTTKSSDGDNLDEFECRDIHVLTFDLFLR